MSQPYIGRAAEAAARAKHNQIHKVKKTAKKKQAKKVPTKAARAIDEALGTFKPVTPVEPAPVEEAVEVEAWIEYGPLGGQDEDAIAREVLGMEVGLPEEPVMAQESPSTAPEETPAQVLPEPPTNAPQGPYWAKQSPVASCLLSLIDALNFLHREGHLRKLKEKDILILKCRIKTARQLIEKL